LKPIILLDILSLKEFYQGKGEGDRLAGNQLLTHEMIQRGDRKLSPL
jgi:hypothetical protein